MAFPVALLGLGSMGAALAKRLLDCGTNICVWNRTTTRPSIKTLLDQGAHLSSTASVAVRASEVVIICVLDYASLDSILEDLNVGVLKDKTVINLTNGTPSQAHEMNERMLRGCSVQTYFDGAIMTTPALIGTKASFLFCSGGTPESFDDKAVNLLEEFGRVDYVGSDPGAAAVNDLALLAGMYGMFDGTLTTTGLLLKARSVPVEASEKRVVADTISTKLVPMLNALLPTLTSIAEQVENGDDRAGDHPNSMLSQGLRNIVSACDEAGVDAGASKHLLSVLEAVVAGGGGSSGIGLVGRRYF